MQQGFVTVESHTKNNQTNMRATANSHDVGPNSVATNGDFGHFVSRAACNGRV